MLDENEVFTLIKTDWGNRYDFKGLLLPDGETIRTHDSLCSNSKLSGRCRIARKNMRFSTIRRTQDEGSRAVLQLTLKRL